MSLDTKVKNLIINTNMTKEQYEAIDDKSNQLFFVEDSSVVDVPAPEENQSGYLHTDGANLTWKEIESGDKLPDQTDNTGKFLMTDGENASWGNALVNTTEGIGSVSINSTGIDTKPNYSQNIGGRRNGQSSYSVSIGFGSLSSAFYSVAIGVDATASAHSSIAIGGIASAANAIQLGHTDSDTKNPDANTFKVANENGNFEIMSADGTIPTDRYTTTPTDAGTYVPKLTIAEDGTATREWSTESGGGVSGDYLPLSGGTMTGPIKFSEIFTGSDISISADYYGIWGGPVFVVRGGTLISGDIHPLNDKVTSLGMPNDSVPEEGGYGYGGLYYRRICTTAINNGASTDDIKVPTTGGTMVVATPPTDNGTYVLKATVVDGVVTTEWVLEA